MRLRSVAVSFISNNNTSDINWQIKKSKWTWSVPDDCSFWQRPQLLRNLFNHCRIVCINSNRVSFKKQNQTLCEVFSLKWPNIKMFFFLNVKYRWQLLERENTILALTKKQRINTPNSTQTFWPCFVFSVCSINDKMSWFWYLWSPIKRYNLTALL